MDCSRRVLATSGEFLDPRPIFDPAMRSQISNYCEIDNFLNLHAYISNTMNCSDLKFSPACSQFNSEKNEVLLCLLTGYV